MRHDLTIICDDLRQEIGRKLSFMGVYDEAIVFKTLPARVQKIALYQRWSGEDQPGQMRIELTGSAITGTFSAVVMASHEARPEARRANVLVAFAPVDVVETGVMEFRTYLGNDDRPSHTHSIEVRIEPDLKL
jgi:hypothetical protein